MCTPHRAPPQETSRPSKQRGEAISKVNALQATNSAVIAIQAAWAARRHPAVIVTTTTAAMTRAGMKRHQSSTVVPQAPSANGLPGLHPSSQLL